MKDISFSVALARFDRYQQWRKGKIDNWSSKNRVPPPKTLDEMFTKIRPLVREAAEKEAVRRSYMKLPN